MNDQQKHGNQLSHLIQRHDQLYNLNHFLYLSFHKILPSLMYIPSDLKKLLNDPH